MESVPVSVTNGIFTFKCGEMIQVDGKVKPRTSQGYVKIYVNPDNLLCWEWVNTEDESQSSEPFVIFPEDCEWIKVKTTKGRVYQLKSTQFESSYIYWLQDPDVSKDAELESRIREILKFGSLSIPKKDLKLKDDTAMNVDSEVKVTQPVSAGNDNVKLIMDQITNALNKTGKSKINLSLFLTI